MHLRFKGELTFHVPVITEVKGSNLEEAGFILWNLKAICDGVLNIKIIDKMLPVMYASCFAIMYFTDRHIDCLIDQLFD